METGLYSVERDESGHLQKIVRNADGAQVPQDPNHPDHKTFLAWNAAQTTPIDTSPWVLPDGHVIFREVGELVAYCKECGLMLYHTGFPKQAEPFPSKSHAQLPTEKTTVCHLLAVTPAYDMGPGPKLGLFWKTSRVWVTNDVYFSMQKDMVDDRSDIRRITSWPIKRTFVYIDVSDFSKMASGWQVLVINSIVTIARSPEFWPGIVASQAREGIEAKICIGDGYIFVFKDPSHATTFAGCLAYLIEHRIAAESKAVPVEFHFRIGVHVGLVFCFWDFDRQKWNYIGHGINGGNRVLTAAGKSTDDVVYISDDVRRAISGKGRNEASNRDLLRNLHNRGRHADKHGEMWRLYGLNHTDFGEAVFSQYAIQDPNDC